MDISLLPTHEQKLPQEKEQLTGTLEPRKDVKAKRVDPKGTFEHEFQQVRFCKIKKRSYNCD